MRPGLYRADAYEALASLKDDSIDCMLTDSPYSPKTHANGRRGAGKGKVSAPRELGFAALTPGDRLRTAAEAARTVRRWSLFFSDHEGSCDWKADLEAVGLEVVRFGVWVKPGAPPQFTGDRPAQGHEVIVMAHRPGRKKWNGGGRHAVFTHPIVRPTERYHTTQKPLSLMRELVELFTDPGELVCDPFAGSGTTAVACKELSRRCLSFEREDASIEAARARIGAARPKELRVKVLVKLVSGKVRWQLSDPLAPKLAISEMHDLRSTGHRAHVVAA